MEKNIKHYIGDHDIERLSPIIIFVGSGHCGRYISKLLKGDGCSVELHDTSSGATLKLPKDKPELLRKIKILEADYALKKSKSSDRDIAPKHHNGRYNDRTKNRKKNKQSRKQKKQRK